MQRALIAGVIVSIVAPAIGVFMVLRRLSLIGDTLSHTAFAGVALGSVLNIFPLWSALIITTLGALGIVRVRYSARLSGDASLAVFFSMGFALGIVLLSISNSSISLSSLLFGSILLVSLEDLLLIGIIGLVAASIVAALYGDLLHLTLDEDLAQVSGLPVKRLDYLLSILTGIVVVASMRIVGILLVSSLLVIPALASLQISRSFRETIHIAILLAFLSVVTGMAISFYASIPPGGTIVLTSIFIFLITVFFKGLHR